MSFLLRHVYLDLLLRKQLASQIAPVLSRMSTAVNITAERVSMKKATSIQTPIMMAMAASKDKEARTQRLPRSNAMVLHTQTTSMVTGHTMMKSKPLASASNPGALVTRNQTRLSSSDPTANARSARTVKRSCAVRIGLRLFATWNVNG